LDVHAQLKSYLTISGGVSNPQGDYGSTDYSNNHAGFAKRGVTFGFDGAVYVFKKLAIGYTFSFQDQGKLTYNDVNILAQGYTASFKADQTTVNGYDRFHNWNLLVGPQYSFTYRKFILDLRAFGGLVDVTSTPETVVELVGVPKQANYFYERRGHGLLLGYGASAGLRFKLDDSWTIGIKSGYISSKGPNITVDGLTDNIGRYVTNIPIREIQTTFGIGLSF